MTLCATSGSFVTNEEYGVLLLGRSCSLSPVAAHQHGHKRCLLGVVAALQKCVYREQLRERSLDNVEGSVLVPVKTKRVVHLCELNTRPSPMYINIIHNNGEGSCGMDRAC